jgi:monovalent cation:H+ antiporter-2, CPA2 family
MAAVCEHLDQIRVMGTEERVCPECVAAGDTWMHLRLCLTCGQVGCCDSSKNQHASKHAASSGHPIVGSLEPGEAWHWCYVDEMVV